MVDSAKAMISGSWGYSACVGEDLLQKIFPIQHVFPCSCCISKLHAYIWEWQKSEVLSMAWQAWDDIDFDKLSAGGTATTQLLVLVVSRSVGPLVDSNTQHPFYRPWCRCQFQWTSVFFSSSLKLLTSPFGTSSDRRHCHQRVSIKAISAFPTCSNHQSSVQSSSHQPPSTSCFRWLPFAETVLQMVSELPSPRDAAPQRLPVLCPKWHLGWADLRGALMGVDGLWWPKLIYFKISNIYVCIYIYNIMIYIYIYIYILCNIMIYIYICMYLLKFRENNRAH